MVSKKQREWAERLEREEAKELGIVVEEVPLPFAPPAPAARNQEAPPVPRTRKGGRSTAEARPRTTPEARPRTTPDDVADTAIDEDVSAPSGDSLTDRPHNAPKKGFECCERCKRTIGGTVKDPVVHTSLGKHCNPCCVKAHAEKAVKDAEHHETVRARKSASMKARWTVNGGVEAEEADEEGSDDDG